MKKCKLEITIKFNQFPFLFRAKLRSKLEDEQCRVEVAHYVSDNDLILDKFVSRIIIVLNLNFLDYRTLWLPFFVGQLSDVDSLRRPPLVNLFNRP